MALTDKLTAIANAIRAKTGRTATMTLTDMVTEIGSISGGGYVSPYYAEYDFSAGKLTDLARGCSALPFVSAREYTLNSDGLTLLGLSAMVDIQLEVVEGLTVEFDVTSETRPTGSTHRRTICVYSQSGTPDNCLCLRSGSYWAVYTSASGWKFNDSSDNQSIAGKTIKFVFSTYSDTHWKFTVYIGETEVATDCKLTKLYSNIFIGSSSTGYTFGVSKVRAYIAN